MKRLLCFLLGLAGPIGAQPFDPLPPAEYHVSAQGGLYPTFLSYFGAGGYSGDLPANVHMDWQGQYKDTHGDVILNYSVQAMSEAYGTSGGIVRPMAISTAEAHGTAANGTSQIGGFSDSSITYYVRVTPTQGIDPLGTVPVRTVLRLVVDGRANSFVRIGSDILLHLDIISGHQETSLNYTRQAYAGALDMVQLRAYCTAVDTMSSPSQMPTSSMALADPTFELDQEAFDAYMGQDTFPLSDYYKVELSPGIEPTPIEWVNVGNGDNDPDANGRGAVHDPFKISKHEITCGQWFAFLVLHGLPDPHGLYDPRMEADCGIRLSTMYGGFAYYFDPAYQNKPISHVSWYDAARYVNWVANGYGVADTETGCYTLNGATSGIIPKNPGAPMFLPSEDQWYKAAYYNGSSETYSPYAHQSATISPTDANYRGSSSSVDVGSFASKPSFYGTLNQGGNVWEWTDSVIDGDRGTFGIRGGSWLDGPSQLRSSTRGQNLPTFQSYGVGFRIAASVEPEP